MFGQYLAETGQLKEADKIYQKTIHLLRDEQPTVMARDLTVRAVQIGYAAWSETPEHREYIQRTQKQCIEAIDRFFPNEPVVENLGLEEKARLFKFCLNILSCCLDISGHTDDALTTLQKARKQFPDVWDVFNNYIVLLRRHNRQDDAEKELRQALNDGFKVTQTFRLLFELILEFKPVDAIGLLADYRDKIAEATYWDTSRQSISYNTATLSCCRSSSKGRCIRYK